MNLLIPILLSVFAGLCTGIGSLISILFKKMNLKTLSFSLGLSAGVMVYVSFVELLPQGVKLLGTIPAIGLFFGGVSFILILDYIIPESKNPHHIVEKVMPTEGFEGICTNPNGSCPIEPEERKNILKRLKQKREEKQKKMSDSARKVERMGILTAVTIFLHNVPEGLITFVTAAQDIKLGLVIAFAVAIHNIPEGISVAMPIMYATNDKKQAFWYSFTSGLAEPISAIIAALILAPFLTSTVIGYMLVFTAGIMVYISLDEILPTAHKYCADEGNGDGHSAGIGVIVGMFIMAVSLIILTPK